MNIKYFIYLSHLYNGTENMLYEYRHANNLINDVKLSKKMI